MSSSGSITIRSAARAGYGPPERVRRNLPSGTASVARKLQARRLAQVRLRASRRQLPAVPTWTSVPGSMIPGPRPGSARIRWPRSTTPSAPTSTAPGTRSTSWIRKGKRSGLFFKKTRIVFSYSMNLVRYLIQMGLFIRK